MLPPNLDWWVTLCPRHTLYHSSERQTGGWCSSVQPPAKPSCIQSIGLSNIQYNRVPFVLSKSEIPAYLICSCAIHPCHCMIFHVVGGAQISSPGSMNQWASSTRPWNSSSSQVAVRWSSWFWCLDHFSGIQPCHFNYRVLFHDHVIIILYM